MFTTRHPRRYLVPLVGTGLVLVSLFGCLTLPAASFSGIEPTGYRDYRDYQGYHDHQGYWDYRDNWGYRDYRDYRPYQRPRYELPDRYTIHKGKKCEVRCERIRGTRDYRCREYRC
jgi:hypothetical protein